MYYDVTRRLELLRPVRLDVSDQQESAQTVNNWSMLTPKMQVVRIMHGALEKKDFFSWWSVPTLLFCIVKSAKNKQIHRKVKCAHLVPESGSRWRRHVVPGSKRKSPHRKSDTEMHRTDVVPELAGRVNHDSWWSLPTFLGSGLRGWSPRAKG